MRTKLSLVCAALVGVATVGYSAPVSAGFQTAVPTVTAAGPLAITGTVVKATANYVNNTIDEATLFAVKQLGGAQVALQWLGSNGTVGHTVPSGILGTATADITGRYAIYGVPTMEMLAEAKKNDGWLNFFVMTTVDGMSTMEGISRHWSGSTWTEFTKQDARPGFSPSVDHTVVFATDVATGQAKYQVAPASSTATPAFPPAYCTAVVEDYTYNTTNVIEFHNSADSDGHWEYGATADSDVTIGFKAGTGDWNLSGTSHVANTLGGTVYGNHNSQFGKYIGTTMRYEHGLIDGPAQCASHGTHYIRAIQWTGGTAWVWDVSQYDCLDAPQSNPNNRDYYERYTGFTKNTARAGAFSNAGTIGSPYGNLTVSATSGYSVRVDMNWYWARNWGYICGNNGKPINAQIVYVF